MTIASFSATCPVQFDQNNLLNAILRAGIQEIGILLPWPDESPKQFPPADALSPIFARARAAGIKTSLILGSGCSANREFTPHGMAALLGLFQGVHEWQVDCLTISQPFLTRAIRHFCPQTQIKIAAAYQADSPGKFEFLLDNLNVDVVQVSPLANKDFRFLRELCRRWDSGRLEIVCTATCLMGCPYHTWHQAYLAHAHLLEPRPFLPHMSPCQADITGVRHCALASMFIRREDVPHYQKLGIQKFNIQVGLADTLDAVEYYTGQTVDGYLPSFLKQRFEGYETVDLTAMKGYYAPFTNEDCDGRTYNCTACEHCGEYADRVLGPTPEGPARRLPEPALFFKYLYFSRHANAVAAQLMPSNPPTLQPSNPPVLQPSSPPNIFPSEPLASDLLTNLLEHITRDYEAFFRQRGLGDLLGAVHPRAAAAWKKLVPFNPNNIGNWSVEGGAPYMITTQQEQEVVQKMAHLYGIDSRQVEGYMASGGTEGNLLATWMGRKYLEKYLPREQIRLLRTDLTHYSIAKAADVCGLPEHRIAVERRTWNMSPDNLQEQLRALHAQGGRGFLLPLTAGYTVGGTSDDIAALTTVVQSLQQELRGLRVFIWIDAALAGLVLPFTPPGFQPFEAPLVQALIVDFHKFGGVPYPAGLILYRRELRPLIEKHVPYTVIKDNTLLGSRPGISAVAAWMAIHALGFQGLAQEVAAQLARKQSFLKELRAFDGIEVITAENSVQVAIVAQDPLPDEFCEPYGIYPLPYRIHFTEGAETLLVYKLFFLPQFTPAPEGGLS